MSHRSHEASPVGVSPSSRQPRPASAAPATKVPAGFDTCDAGTSPGVHPEKECVTISQSNPAPEQPAAARTFEAAVSPGSALANRRAVDEKRGVDLPLAARESLARTRASSPGAAAASAGVSGGGWSLHLSLAPPP